eukprot:2032738-Rhodomonas_salina.1
MGQQLRPYPELCCTREDPSKRVLREAASNAAQVRAAKEESPDMGHSVLCYVMRTTVHHRVHGRACVVLT